MKHFLKNIGVGLISLILMLVYLPASVSAAEKGTVIVQFSDCDFPVTDYSADITLCKIADYSENNTFILTEEFSDCGFTIDEMQAASASEKLSIAENLQNYVQNKSVSGNLYNAVLNEDKVIEGIDEGVYLIIIDNIEDGNLLYSFSPVICTIPSLDVYNEICYKIGVSPKYSLIDQSIIEVTTDIPEPTEDSEVTEPTEPTGPAETTVSEVVTSVTETGTTTEVTTSDDDERLPQTGPLMWIVYLLAGAGMMSLITVWGFSRKQSSSKKGKITFMIIGCCCLAGAGAICGDSYLTERSSLSVMSDALVEIKSAQPELKEVKLTEDTLNEITDLPAAAEPEVFEVDGNQYIGILEIPALSLELPVAADCSMKTLKKSPGRYKGNTISSDMVIGAHNYESHFGTIHELTSECDVTFTDIDGNVYRYRVSEITEVSPEQVDAVCDSGHDLALFTCNSSGARRVVAFCDAI